MLANGPKINAVYKPTWVANSFLFRAFARKIFDIDPLKIQKLVYVFHGWTLAVRGYPAIGEQFEPWPHGPVNSTLYHKFKTYRYRSITEYAKDIDPVTGKDAANYVPPSDTDFYDVFDRVWNRYIGMSGPELSNLTHAAGTPWSIAREQGLLYIPNALIQRHYLDLSELTIG